MTEPPRIPDWIAMLVGKREIELEGMRLENEALRNALAELQRPRPSEPSG